jgi:hypothetical protein
VLVEAQGEMLDNIEAQVTVLNPNNCQNCRSDGSAAACGLCVVHCRHSLACSALCVRRCQHTLDTVIARSMWKELADSAL